MKSRGGDLFQVVDPPSSKVYRDPEVVIKKVLIPTLFETPFRKIVVELPWERLQALFPASALEILEQTQQGLAVSRLVREVRQGETHLCLWVQVFPDGYFQTSAFVVETRGKDYVRDWRKMTLRQAETIFLHRAYSLLNGIPNTEEV